MEIRVDTYVEDFQGTRKLINRAYLTLVAVDSNNVPGKVPAFLLVIYEIHPDFYITKSPPGRMRREHSFFSEVEKAEWETAKRRKELRIQRQKEGF